MSSSARGNLHAATGSSMTAKGWGQEAALRMLHNNLEPSIPKSSLSMAEAEKPPETGQVLIPW
jgi:urocanate hydratase